MIIHIYPQGRLCTAKVSPFIKNNYWHFVVLLFFENGVIDTDTSALNHSPKRSNRVSQASNPWHFSRIFGNPISCKIFGAC